MKTSTLALLSALSLPHCGTAMPVFAIALAEEIPGASAGVSASSTCPGTSAAHLTNNAGMDGLFRHDNAGNASTMWHTAEKATPSAPAPGLPASPAWVRFDFKEAQSIGSCQIWNHNQKNLTNRGFRHARAFVSADGKTFEPVKVNGQEIFEMPQAKGGQAEPATFTLTLPGTGTKSVILAAVDNWGGNAYGLCEVQFFGPSNDVALENMPVPEKLSAREFPFLFNEKDGSWTRQVRVDLDTPLREAATHDLAIVHCGQ